MWVPGSITFLIVVFVYVHRWLAPPAAPGSAPAPRLASGHRRRSANASACATILASFQTGSVLTLVLPLAVLIAVVVWYVLLWSAAPANAEPAPPRRPTLRTAPPRREAGVGVAVDARRTIWAGRRRSGYIVPVHSCSS